MARLEGMYQIKDYVKRSESTVLGYIRTLEFPATKLGKIWISETDKIDRWFLDQIENGNGTPAAAVPEPKSSETKKKSRYRKFKKK